MAIRDAQNPRPDPALVIEIDHLVTARAAAKARFDDKNSAFEQLQSEEAAAHAADIASDQEEMDALDARLWNLIPANEPNLIKNGKKSFITGVARIQFTDYQKKESVDAAAIKGIMGLARSERVVKLIAKPKVTWTFVKDMFFPALGKMKPELRKKFQQFVTVTPAYRTLKATLNQTYAVFHDSERVSREPMDIKKPDNFLDFDSTPEES